MSEADATVSFSEFLRTLLPEDLSTATLQRSISRETGKTVLAVKEKLRRARTEQTEAFDFPYLHEIITVLDRHKGQTMKQVSSPAQILRHIVSQQHFNLGLGILSFKAGDPGRPGLEWLRFPKAYSDFGDALHSSDHYRQWKHYVNDGDYSFYRTTLQLYYSLQDSPCHAPTRLFIAPRLARAAITYGDYTDAYLICSRLETAWNHYIAQILPSGNLAHLPDTNTDQHKRSLYAYLDALQIKAVSVSLINFYRPLTSSQSYFEHADSELTRWSSKEIAESWKLCPENKSYLFMLLHMRILRMYCKLMISEYSDPTNEKILMQAHQKRTNLYEICYHAYLLELKVNELKRYKEDASRKKLELENAKKRNVAMHGDNEHEGTDSITLSTTDHFTALDTLARTYYIMCLMPHFDEIFSKELNDIEANFVNNGDISDRQYRMMIWFFIKNFRKQYGLVTKEALLKKASSLFTASKDIRELSDLEESIYRNGQQSSLKKSRSNISDVFSRLATDTVSKSHSSYDALLQSLIETISPHRMRHNKFILYTLEQFITNVTNDGYVKPIADGEEITSKMTESSIKRSLRDLDVEAAQFQELFFSVDPKSDLHVNSLLHAWKKFNPEKTRHF